MTVPDIVKADIIIEQLREWEAKRAMPNLVLIILPSDHTEGTNPGWCTPQACVADNDLALGRIVEGFSHSPFWKSMAIFAVEDDAQNGVDHVDGHRTVALVASPYARRGVIDPTFYGQPSMVKTIELMLGLPALSLFDLVATDMRASFIGPDEAPNLAPYTATQHSDYARRLAEYERAHHDGEWRHEVSSRREPPRRTPREGVGPGREGNRRRKDAQKDEPADGARGCGPPLAHQLWCVGQAKERSHRAAGPGRLQCSDPMQNRLLGNHPDGRRQRRQQTEHDPHERSAAGRRR